MRTARFCTWGYVLVILLCITARFAAAAGPPSDVDAAIAEIRTRIADGWYREARDAAEALLTRTLVSHGSGALETAAAMNVLSESLLLAGHPNDPRILELCRTSRDIRERLLGPEHVAVAESLAIEGRILQTRGRPSEARPPLERALAIDERALGPDDLEVANRLMELAETTWGDEATELYERALAIRAGALGPDHPDVAVAQVRVASAREDTGADIGETTAVIERALSTIERTLGPDHPEVATTLTYMVGNVSRLDSRRAAITLLERVRTIRELRLGPEHPDVAFTFNLLAVQYFGSGDSAEAESLFARSRTMLEQIFGPEHPLIGFPLAGGASILSSRLQLAEAKAAFERALGLFERAYGPEHPTVAMTLNELAIVAHRSGQFTEAKALWERALYVQEKLRGPDHLDVALALNNLAFVLANLGSYAEAEPLYLRSLAINERQLGPDDENVASSLRNIARLYLNMGRCAEAKPPTERALAIFEKQSPPESRRVADALSTLAFAQHCLGLYTDARRSMERALVLFESHFGPDHQIIARRLTNLAQILDDSGSRDEAVALLRRATAIVEIADAPEHSIFSAEVYSNLAGLLLVTGATEDARRLALRAEEIGRTQLERTAPALSEQRGLRYSAIRTSTLDLLISIAAGPSAGDEAARREAWDSLVRSRGLVLDTMASRHRTVAAAGDPETAEVARRYAAASQRLANLYVRGPGDGSSKIYDAALADAQREKQQAEERLASLSLSFHRTQAMERAGLVEVSQALGESDALVAYARYRRFSSSSSAGRAEPVPSYAAFVLHRGAVNVVGLGEAREIDALVAEVRNAIAREASAPGRSARRSEAAYRTAGNALRSRIWDPLAPHLAGARTVFIVPDGSLNLVAFAGLPAGRTDYLLRTGPTIHYLSAERDLASMAVPWTAGQGLLAVGGAAFDDVQVVTASAGYRGPRSACGDFRNLTFDPLPATLDECEEVSSIWERVGGSALRLTGRAATEAGFKESAPGKRVVHAATHGFFLGGGCPSAVEVVGKREGIGAMSENDPVPGGGESPLVLAGLAFAGANRRNLAGADDDDGILTAEEIGALDLAGVEWAVLSGCETGVGEVLAGEGVLGLRRAFQTAGVRTLIMSLWTVEDESTRLWMNALYRHHLGDGLSTAESVRRASVEVLAQRKRAGLSTHPFYWAGFVAAGDWR